MSAPRQRPLLVALFCVCAAVWTIAPAAHADSATAGASMDKFEEGKQAFKAGRFAEALAAYETSLALEPSPNTRFQIAKCQVALGKTASAYLNFKRAAQEAQDRVNATQEKRYAATRTAALTEAEALKQKVPRLILRITATAPEGFAITLDGNPVPQPAWGLGLEVDPGDHTAVATGPRLQRFTSSFTLGEGEQKQIDIPLTKMPTAVVRFELKTKPAGLSLTLDDQPLSPEQYGKPQSLDVGTHRVVASAPGYAEFVWNGFLTDGESSVVSIALRSQAGGPPKWATFLVGGLTIAAFAVGIGFGVKAKNVADEQLLVPPLLRDPTIQDAVRTDAIVANAFFAIGGVFAINTVILAATTRWRTESPAAPKKGVKHAALPLIPSVYQMGHGVSLSGDH
jgi:hypothetical protein